MLFNMDITVPAQTLATAPYTVDLDLAPGNIQKFRVEFPFGCAELVGIQLYRSNHQIWPITPGEFVSWEAGGVETEENLELSDLPFGVQARCVNYDILYDHTISLYVVVRGQKNGILGDIAARLRLQL